MRYFNFGVSLEDYPAVKRWTDTIGQRPAVQRGMEVLKPLS
jgi:glutathione S-transferase